MIDDANDQAGSAELVAQRHGLGRRLSTTQLRSRQRFAGGLALLAVGVGGFVLLFNLGVPRTGGRIAGSIVIALLAVNFGVGGVLAIREGMAVQGGNIHTHEHGLVAETRKGPLPLPYADMLLYREQTDIKQGSATVDTVVRWRIERRDGTPSKIGTEASGRLQALLDMALAKACQEQAAPEAAALAAGATLTYGPVSFDRHRLRARKLDVAWSLFQRAFANSRR